jgi:hypothetical protein
MFGSCTLTDPALDLFLASFIIVVIIPLVPYTCIGVRYPVVQE